MDNEFVVKSLVNFFTDKEKDFIKTKINTLEKKKKFFSFYIKTKKKIVLIKINKDFKNLIEKRVEIVHQKLVDQNNESKVIKDFKLLVEKRVESTHKKLIQQKINQ